MELGKAWNVRVEVITELLDVFATSGLVPW